MAKSKKPDRPAGSLAHLPQAFLGAPFSFVMDRESQQVAEQIRTRDSVRDVKGQLLKSHDVAGRTHLEAQRTRQEVTRVREGVQQLLPAMSHLARANAEGFERVEATLNEGLGELANGIDGISAARKPLDQLTREGHADEDELAIMASRGLLPEDKVRLLKGSMPEWKQQILHSGLVERPDLKREKKLSDQQRLYLARMRRLNDTPTSHLGSLRIAAHHRLLDPDIHRRMSVEVRAVRTGLTGTVDALNERLAQGDRSLRNDDRRDALLHAGVLGIGRLGAVNQAQLAELRTNNVLQARTASGVERVADHTGALVEGQREALRIHSANVAASLATERHTADIARSSQQLVELGSQNLAANVATARGVGELVGYSAEIADRVIELRDVAKAHLGVSADIRDGIWEGNADRRYFGELHSAQLGALAEGQAAQLEMAGHQLSALNALNHNLAVVADIGRQTLASELRQEGLLELLNEQTAQTNALVDAVRATIAAVAADQDYRDRNPNLLKGDDWFRQGLEALGVGDIQGAIRVFNEAIEAYIADFRAYFHRGICRVYQDDFDQAESDFKMGLRYAEKKADKKVISAIRLNLARLYYAQSKVDRVKAEEDGGDAFLEKALTEAARVIADTPDYLEGHFAMAKYLAEYRLYDQALNVLAPLIQKDSRYLYRAGLDPIFEPLFEPLKTTFGIEIEGDAKEYTKRPEIYFSIAQDAMRYGDVEMVQRCLSYLIHGELLFLIEKRLWELPEFKPFEDYMKEEILKVPEKGQVFFYWYLLAHLAHRYDHTRSIVFKFLMHGLNEDPCFEGKNLSGLQNSLKKAFGDLYEVAVLYIRTTAHDDLKWLAPKI